MIRLILLVCFVLGVSGSVLYMTKQSVDSRYDELSQLRSQIAKAEERAAILEAEWAMSAALTGLNLSGGLLSMRPISADRSCRWTQFRCAVLTHQNS